MKKTLVLLAFLLQLTNGQQAMIHNAVGFVVIEIDKVQCLGFFDRQQKPLTAVPVKLIEGAIFIPDDKVM